MWSLFMNLDKKLELAHELAMEFVSKNKDLAFAPNTVAYNAWEYADAMEAEYNKRKQAESEQNAKQSKILFEQLTKNKDGSCAHFHTTLNKAECFDCGSRLNDEFQVDWSVAPDGYDWWAVDGWGAWWFDQEPKWINFEWGGYVVNKHNRSATEKAPSFNYQGDWKDSLRKRP